MHTILIVDDEPNYQIVLSEILKDEGYEVFTANSGLAGLPIVYSTDLDLVLSDMKMPGMDGIAFLEKIKEYNKELPVILITAYAEVEKAVEAMRLGAFTYLAKPFSNQQLLAGVRKAIEHYGLIREIRRLRDEATPRSGFGGMIGKSPSMRAVYQLIEKVAPTPSSVLITGESGTGKDVVARLIHERSPLAGNQMVIKNCASLQKELARSELFGHVKGSFTGANESREGLLSFAHDSTLFLDEIGELPLEVQASLLRVLETGTYRRVGEKEERTVTIRFLFATNRHLAEEVERGQFNEAFFHRINAFSIQIPSLKERKEDLPLLVDYFLTTLSPDGSGGYRLVDNAMACILRYGWPGNIRELRNVIERSIILAENGIITERCLPRELVESAENGAGAALSLASVERQHILKMLEFHGGNRQQTADTLGISRKTLYRKLTEYAID